MSLKRALSTQERVDLAVAAGHTKLVMEHIRIHNGQGEGTGQLSVHTTPGNTTHYIYLPDYAFAAIDCYLTSLGVPLEGKAPKASMLSLGHLQYANHCHEQAAYFKSQSGKTFSGRLKEDAGYAAAHTAFSMIEEIIQEHPIEIHGSTILFDKEHEIYTLKLASGRMVCRTKGSAAHHYYKPDGCTCRWSVDEILNHELNELANTLHDKGPGLPY